jgi:hypothetical protein
LPSTSAIGRQKSKSLKEKINGKQKQIQKLSHIQPQEHPNGVAALNVAITQ